MIKHTKKDIEYMRLAIKLAEKAKDRTYPNPMVGAVIVKNSRVMGRGYHRRAGEDHAEIRAIKDASERCKGAAMYVTLEPCDHHGKTPPCTRAIIDAGIKKVYAAVKDPNPINRGRGISRLRGAGIEVNVGMCSEEACALNRKYTKYVTTGLPYVTLKLAQSLDGRIAAGDGSSKWITAEKARKHARKMRSNFDAIVIGVNTALKDDPFLLDEKRRGYKVCRMVVDSRLSLPLSANLVKTADKAPVVIATTQLAPKGKMEEFRKINGIEVMVFKSRTSRVPLRTFFKKLAASGMVNILVEGGGTLAGSLMDEALADELMFFIAPRIIGGEYVSVKSRGVKSIADAVELKDVMVKRFGPDILISGKICLPES